MLAALVVVFVGISCPFPVADTVTPVAGVVTRDFVEPSCTRCAGRRGITVSTRVGSAVRATRHGRITFAGQVGGALWVVQEVAPGVRVTYGRLAEITSGVETGTEATRGSPVGVAGPAVYLGVRVGETPRNPLRCWTRSPRLVATDVGGSRRPR